MAQIFFIGSSSVYGVGGQKGGVADLIKMELHQKMYSPGGIGEENGHEVYNLAVPGATSRQTIERLESEIKTRAKSRRVIALFSGGSNDTKYLSDPNDTSLDNQYRQNVIDILNKLKELTDDIVVFGLTPVDESKTNPRVQKNGEKVYFFNQIRKRQETILMRAAREKSIPAISLFDEAIANQWIKEYLYDDGLHPNTNGHQWIAKKIKNVLWNLLETE